MRSFYITIVLFSFLIQYTSSAQVQFSEVGNSMGLGGSSYGNGTLGGGISFYDFDQDGWDDLTISSEAGSPIRFYRNDNGTFFEEIFPTGINDPLYETKTPQWVDFDNDGDLDLFVTSNVPGGDNKLYENNGSFQFTDITVACGLSSPDLHSFGGSWGDIDNDGDLDLFVSTRIVDSSDTYNVLYRNNGDGTFTDISVQAGIYQEQQASFCTSFIDYDKDGYQDIYLANDKYWSRNILYRNNGDGTFTDTGAAAGVDVEMDAMSTTIGDYNKDGWLDIYVTNTQEGNVFYKNNGDGTFTDVAAENGTLMQTIAWGAVFLDGDNDTNLDLYVSSSVIDFGDWLPDAFYYNDGTGNYTIPSDSGFEEKQSEAYSNAIGDIQNDGYPDIAILNLDPDDCFLWTNETLQTNHWIKVNLIGTESNKQGVGSWIELSVNGEVQYNYTLLGEGYLGQNSSYEFFGVGTATQIDYVKVTWLSGIVDYIENPNLNSHITIIEGNHPLSVNDAGLLQFTVYPNPTSGILNIRNPEGVLGASYEIVDVLGRNIKAGTLETSETSIDVSSLTKGIYVLNLRNDQAKRSKKIVLE